MDPQFRPVSLQYAVLEVPRSEMERNVHDVHEVGQVVEREPGDDVVAVDLLEGEPVDDHPEVVEEGHAHERRPPVTQTARRVEHERPVASAEIGTFRDGRKRLPAVTANALLAEFLLQLLAPLFAETLGGDVRLAGSVFFHQRLIGEGVPLPAFHEVQFAAYEIEQTVFGTRLRSLLHDLVRVDRRR